MKCHECNSEIIDTAKFCPICGAKILSNSEQNVENEMPQEDLIENNYNNIDFNEKANDKNNYFKKLKEKKSPFKRSIIIAIYSLVFIFLCGGLALKGVPNKNIITLGNAEVSKNADDIKKQGLKEIHLLDEEYSIMPGQVEVIKYYTYPENAKGLKWLSSNSNIKVNQSGYVISTKPNEEGIITVSNDDGTIKTQCNVKVLTEKEAFFRTIDYISNHSTEEQKEVDLYADKFKPSGRVLTNKSTSSVDVFNKINTEIAGYQFIQKKFVNAQTKNIIDCDIYVDSVTGDTRKIVTIEYLGDKLEVTDYYYMDGSSYFIFKRNENYYRPIPAQQDFAGSRYYYCKDSLVKWREIEKNTNNNFEKTDYFYDKKGFQWKKYEYENIDSTNKEKSSYTKANEDASLQKQMEDGFLKKERNMLNAAYNIYNKVVQAPQITSVAGYVLDNGGQPMSGISVKVFSEQYKLLVGETNTNNDGSYKINVPVDKSTYTAYISKPGYGETTIYEVDPNLGISTLFQENVYMYPESNMLYNVRLNLINALNGNVLNADEVVGTHVAIRKGINNKKGAIECQFEMYDDYDPFLNIQLVPGNYTVEVMSPGRENSYFTISTLQDNMEVYSNIVPKITDDSVRVVLSWGSTPSDLDSHLFLPDNKHVAYYSTIASNANLDVDDTNSYGPETITIDKLAQGTYKYYIADFINCSQNNYTSMEMSNSFARVDVYTKNGLNASFTVPNNTEGIIWQVFNISNGKIIPVQRYFNNIEDMQWWAADK
ncbi:carboxypeptidase regulatory-like domain-containing protein [Clostridium sp.]|uniref:carboxypeptidase regulatory-like domain-containing protein n=1 Tax=Clostridium sp. TaxID=1506 RepID=UPI003D6D7435